MPNHTKQKANMTSDVGRSYRNPTALKEVCDTSRWQECTAQKEDGHETVKMKWTCHFTNLCIPVRQKEIQDLQGQVKAPGNINSEI